LAASDIREECSTFRLFERYYGEDLEIEIERGEHMSIQSVKGPFEAYGHEVSVNLLGIEHWSAVDHT
jgi:hypothetical protein